jgi:signal transduction histidine kinase
MSSRLDRWTPDSVYLKFLAYLIPMVVTTFLLVFIAFEYVKYQSAIVELEEEISTEIATSSLLIAEATHNSDIGAIRLMLASMLSNPHISGITVYNSSGVVIDSYGTSPDDPGCTKKQIGVNFADDTSVFKVGELSACYHYDSLNEDFYQHTSYLTALTLLLVLVAVVSAFIAYRSAVGIPLTRLYQRILSRVEEGRHEPVDWESNDEIGRVITEYNRMQAHISAQEEAMNLHRTSLEEELHQAHKMEAVGRLAGGIAHDFNNLLTAIVGFAHLARRKFEHADKNVNIRDDLTQVIETAQRASNLTDQLLTFSRKQFVNPRVLNLNRVIDEMHGMLIRIIREDITIETDLADAPLFVEMDKSQLEQILLNLAINAGDAMPGNGRIMISTSSYNWTETAHPEMPDGDYIQMCFIDDGRGISAQDLPNIFEPFYTTKDRQGNSGLGLATVYGIVKQSGGYIYVNSHEHTGTTFTIFLPARSGDEDELPVEDEPSVTAAGPATILVVEDDLKVQALVVTIMQDAGYEVLSASRGKEAMALAQACARDASQHLDLLLTDAILPDMTGMDIASALRDCLPTMRVLYISGHAEEKLLNSSGEFQQGVNFLQKPFSPTQLVQRVNGILVPG